MASTPTPTRLAQAGAETADHLRRVVGRLGRTLRLTHVDGSLSPSQREVLSTIVRRGPLRLSELASDEGLNPTMLSRIVGHLETATLVTRTSDQSDARVVHLSSTVAGRSLWEEIRNERTDALLYALDKLPAEQRRSIEEALPALESLIESLRNRNQ